MEVSAARVDTVGFADGLEANFAAAGEAAGGVEEVDLRVARLGIRLQYAGPALRRLFGPALQSLESVRLESPDLVVRVWDSESTATRMIPPPPDWDLEHSGVVRGLAPGVDAVFTRWASSLSFVDNRQGKAWFWTRAQSQLASAERAAPLRTVLRLWMSRRGIPLVHCGAVGDARGCALIVGPGGAGKSSAALASLQAGIGYLGDDCCLVAPGPPPRAHALYPSAKVDTIALRRLPAIEPLVDGAVPQDGKAVVFVPPDRIVPEAEVAALVIPRIGDQEETQVRPATARAALAALGPNTLLNFPGADQAMLSHLAEMARSVPAYHLDTGTRPDSTAAALAALLEAVSPAGG